MEINMKSTEKTSHAPHQATDELLTFFKALADANRLKLVGLLAQQPYPVEQLAALLGIGVSTTSHHLSRLARAGLVEARAEGHYSVYSLKTDALFGMARRLLSQAELPKLAQDIALDSYDKKVLATFLDEDGRIPRFPAQQKKYLVLLRHVLDAFDVGRRYSEKEVNDLLLRYSDDTARLRRSLVDHGFMAREGGGGDYWRLESSR
jgi:hypothetical protein